MTALDATNARAAVLQAIHQVIPESQSVVLRDDQNLRDQLDIDSMDLVRMAIAIHESTGVDIPEKDYPQLLSVASAVRYLEGLAPG